MIDVSTLAIPLILFLTASGVIAWLTWWLSRQFIRMELRVYKKLEDSVNTILNKMEYHEKHDDQRFLQLQNDIWTIKLRNAAIDGSKTSAEEKKNTK